MRKRIRFRLSFKLFLMTFTVLMTTFVVSFAVIDYLLPRLYRQEFINEFWHLLDELRDEIIAELEHELLAELSQMEIEEQARHVIFMNRFDLESLTRWYADHCWVVVEQYQTVTESFGDEILLEYRRRCKEFIIDYQENICIVSEEDMLAMYGREVFTWDPVLFWQRDHCVLFEEDVPRWSWEEVAWYELRVMRDHYLLYGSSPYQVVEEMLRYFALNYNMRIVVWEIEPETARLGEVLLEFDGRITDIDPMITFLSEEDEIAVRQQNFYSYERGGFAIAMTGTFRPVERVLTFVSALQRQILIGVFFVSIIISALFSHYLARPIVQLSEESKKLRELEFDEKLKIKRRDEIGDLSSNLNFMSYKLKNALDDLQDANEKLKKEMEREREQERQRRNLFTSISHELKTPITILKGEIGGMIDKVGVYKDRDAYLNSAYNWTVTLEKLVAEVLTISRLEGEKMRFDLTRINITALLTKICHTHQTLADNQAVLFHQQLIPDLMIQADQTQLQIALSNVINNAIFHTQSGESVEVVLKKEEEFAIVMVTNAGAYIEDEDLKNLFHPFYRVDKSRNRHTGGSGLGLFIVKNILELHGFEYVIENVEVGVRFVIKMPLC